MGAALFPQEGLYFLTDVLHIPSIQKNLVSSNKLKKARLYQCIKSNLIEINGNLSLVPIDMIRGNAHCVESLGYWKGYVQGNKMVNHVLLPNCGDKEPFLYEVCL